MDAFLIKIMAVGLALSQLFTKPPEQVKLNFNPQAEQELVAQTLRDGCGFMLKNFAAEKLNVEFIFGLLKAPATPGDKAASSGVTERMTKQIDFDKLMALYKIYCKGETTDTQIDLVEVIRFYNETFKDLPDVKTLATIKLPETAVVYDRNGQRFSEIYSENNRRLFVPLAQIPDHVRKAFIAAEDKNFYKHKGIDVVGVIRAFVNNVMSEGRPQGGSTITQQVIKNLLLNDDLTFERKMREMVLATRLEKFLSKDGILELYLNFVFLGRTSWGVEMASRSYFNKSVKDLTHTEAALLAALTKGPNFYNPDKYPDRATERRQYVLARMKEEGFISEEIFTPASSAPLGVAAFESPRARGSFYFLDAIQREARDRKLLGRPYIVRSTIHPDLQKATEQALQEGLVDYESQSGRATWQGPQGNIADDITKYKTDWKAILPKVKPTLYDVPWTLATVVELKRVQVRRNDGRLGGGLQIRVGLSDGRVLGLNAPFAIANTLKLYDLLFVSVNERQTTASLRIPPQVQGAALVLENKTGRVLGMTGGFSYAGSQLNRALHTLRQPGSTLKPFVYLAALNLGFQPNTLIPDISIHLPPLERGGKAWRPKNYDGGSRGLVTIRRAIEQSLNLPTARIMSELGDSPPAGLDYVRGVFQEVGIYQNAQRVYPIVLGAQPARLIDMAVAYATIANDGLKPSVHFIESIEDGGQVVYQRPRFNLQPVASVDRVSFYQMRRILSGTVVRGTAAKLREFEGAFAAKTGTSNDENDAWFIGFTNDITIAVWVGYDSKKVQANLGQRFTGGRIALPIAEKILRASLKVYKDKEELAPPPPEVAQLVADYRIDLTSGAFNGGNFVEVFRRDPSGVRIIDSTQRILRGYETQLGFGSPMGEEDNFHNVPQWDQNGWQTQINPQLPPGYYQPGVEDTYEQGSRRRRQVDPYVVQPPLYRNPFAIPGGP